MGIRLLMTPSAWRDRECSLPARAGAAVDVRVSRQAR
jgi:hypothetical protein